MLPIDPLLISETTLSIDYLRGLKKGVPGIKPLDDMNYYCY